MRQLSLGSLLLLAPLFVNSSSAHADGQEKASAKTKSASIIPAPHSIAKVELVPDTNAISGHGAKLDKNQFKYLIGKAKLLSPTEAEKTRKQWQYAPYYHGNFATKQGTYSFFLFLGGLGTITPPHQKERSFIFWQPPSKP